METNFPDFSEFLIMTDYSAIGEAVCLLSTSTTIQSICQNKMSPSYMLALINKIGGKAGDLCNLATCLQNDKNLFFNSFTIENYKHFFSTRSLLNLPTMEEFNRCCQDIKEQWDITEAPNTNVEKEILRNGYTDKQKLMDKLYPEKNDDCRFRLIKEILFFNWILSRTISIINNVMQEENQIHEDKDKCVKIFDTQMQELQTEANKLLASPYFKYDSIKAASNPLVMALHGKNSAEKIQLLYHKQEDEDIFVTRESMIEYLIYQKINSTPQYRHSNDNNYYESLELVHDNMSQNVYAKRLIRDLPQIFPSLKKDENGKYKIRGNMITFVIVLAGENAKSKNIHTYMQHLYQAPGGFGNIITTRNKLKNIHVKQKKLNFDERNDLTPEERNLEDKYRKFCSNVRDFYQEQTNQSNQSQISLS